MSDSLSHSLDTLLTRYAGLVARAGARHGLSQADVDEVFQDVRVRLWKSRRTSESILSTPGSYLYRTAVSAALTLIERRRMTPGRAVDLHHEVAEDMAITGDAGQRVARAELRAQLELALASLVPTRRPVVRMYLAGYNHEEIAAVMGWTEAKARNLLYRGLEDLRTRLTLAGVTPGAIE
jgi:RNA polymerase sigma-70 factor (ECF subfamily)